MEVLIVFLISYLIGSVPFAYVIGKLFYHTDVRQHGSGNLGGSNTGRVLGSKAGVAVMTFDLLKVTLAVFIAIRISDHAWIMSCAALSASIGHCYPIFVRFHGGKAVAALYGFLFALWVCAGYTPWVFFLPLITFLLVLTVSIIVSLSRILSSLAAAFFMCVIHSHVSVTLAVGIFSALIIVRHHGNIRRMISGTERKISWMK